MTNTDANDSANALLIEILKAQPNLIASQSSGDTAGTDVGDFIAALQARLKAMYAAMP